MQLTDYLLLLATEIILFNISVQTDPMNTYTDLRSQLIFITSNIQNSILLFDG
jgi:hypothetical protein